MIVLWLLAFMFGFGVCDLVMALPVVGLVGVGLCLVLVVVGWFSWFCGCVFVWIRVCGLGFG